MILQDKDDELIRKNDFIRKQEMGIINLKEENNRLDLIIKELQSEVSRVREKIAKILNIVFENGGSELYDQIESAILD